jgi:hypothetical protein
LIGYQISRPAEFCRVEVSESRISLKTEQRYQGLLSFQLELAACPFSIDVLDGAVRARGEICAFKEADCNVDPSGIWGPPGASIGPEQAKSIEKIRAGADKDARAAYRAALSRFAGDRSRTKEITRDQAGFSSVREEACRDYDREDKHGFCASRVTLARAVALSAELAQPVSKPEPKKPEATAKTGQPNTAAAPVTPPVAPTPVPASNPAPEDGLVPTPSFSLPPAALPQQRLR